MKMYSKYIAMVCIAALTSCERTVLPESDTEKEEIGTVSEHLSNISGSVILEQPSATEQTKTTLGDGNVVLWNSGDTFDLLPMLSAKDVLVATINAAPAGLGIQVSNTSNHYVKYEDIKITVGGSDVTSVVTSVGASNDNSYKVGIYNSNKKYQYAPAGTIITADINDNSGIYTLPIVQSSSSSSFSSSYIAVVTLTGIKYGSDNQNWISIDSNTTLSNGFSNKSSISYTWESRDVSKSTGTIAADCSTFNATIDDNYEYYAVYPSSENTSLSGTTLSFTLPQTQTYVAESFASRANPMAGKLQKIDGTYSIAMKNVCGILKLKLKGTEKVTSIDVTDPTSENSLWGNASIDITQIGTDGATVTSGSNTITLDCGNGVQLSPDQPTEFNIVVPVGSFSSGIEIAINTYAGTATKAATVENTVKRSVIKVMPTVSTSRLEFTVAEFNIENDAVAEYLANSTSTLSSTASNYSQSFFDQSRSYRPDQPKTKTITFSNPSGNATVLMSENSDMSNPVLNASVSGESYTLRNMIPGKTYYYRVNSGEEILTAGAFKTTGQMRMIAIDRGFNIRDLGGWTGIDGNKVNYGLVYRGASPGGTDKDGTTSDITDEDRAELNRIGIRAHLDLRAPTNSGKWSGEYSYHSYSRTSTTLSGADFNNTMTDYGAYNQDASVIADVAWIIYELKRGKPVFFNCRQGADRTGTIAFIIEGLLGCYGDDTGHQMAMDYELTGFSQANLIDNKTVDTSYRGATEAYSNTNKLFNQLLNLTASGVTLSNLQQKCYYYLNQYASKTSIFTDSMQTIDKADLDWFINYMLGVTDLNGDLLPEHSSMIASPSWAVSTGTDLQTIAESKATVVNYIQ